MTTPAHDTSDAIAQLTSGLGPAAYAERADVPDATIHGDPRIVPMRVASDFFIAPRDPDPRGMTVLGADGAIAGTVSDVWVDRAEPQVRYFEMTLDGRDGRVLVPVPCAKVHARRRTITVKALLASQFAHVPTTAHADRVTLLEEDRIMAYFAGGYLYATPSRSEPLV